MDDTDKGGGVSHDISDDELIESPIIEYLTDPVEMETQVELDNFTITKNTGAIPKNSTPRSPPLKARRPVISTNTVTPRHKAYPDDSKGPWVVFFRTKEKPLNIPRISKDLTARFSAVTDIFRVTPNKLRVTVDDRKQANRIVTCELFSIEYRVYIPSRDVEIEGVVTEASLTCQDILDAASYGSFKNRALPSVKILDCTQMQSMSVIDGRKTYSLSGSFRVTFSGSALPDT